MEGVEVKNVGFVIPLIDGKFYLARRVKEPNKKLWGAIGGKPMSYFSASVLNKEMSINNREVHPVETASQSMNLETPRNAAIRELCEEVFSDKVYPHDFGESDFYPIESLGSRVDAFEGKKVKMYFFLVNINRKDFHINREELYKKLVPLEKIHPKKIWPMTREVLFDLKFELEVASYFFKGYPEDFLSTLAKNRLANQIPRKMGPVRGPMKGDIGSGIYSGIIGLNFHPYKIEIRSFWKALGYHKHYDNLSLEEKEILNNKLFDFLINEGFFDKDFFMNKKIED